jgi:2-polyprenyl-3-methyl-5-hydroxy-6-metoxy-1,4-benzoquinol methylase
MQEQFEQIKSYFKKKDQDMIRLGKLPMRSTEKGFWGVSNLDDVKDFFEQKQFSSDATFMDLGCGDGRVVLVASLYVNASGIEYDKELVQDAQAAAKELDMDIKCIQGDFKDTDFSQYDILYSYADQNWNKFKEKLQEELTGELYCYHDTYHPDFLEKQKITWVGQIPIFGYRNS